MNYFQKSESIKAGLRKSFQDGSSKMAKRRCYYYLYEEDGVLSMLPWEYNLAFGSFQSSSADATELVNFPIDSPVSGGDLESRPMISWIFQDEKATQQYHAYFAQFLAEFFESGSFQQLVDETVEQISPYVEKDPTKFCTYEEFQTAAQTLSTFCTLRAESIAGQLDGSIPSTSEGQAADSESLIDASGIQLSDMGSFTGGAPGRGGRERLEDAGHPDAADGNRAEFRHGAGRACCLPAAV